MTYPMPETQTFVRLRRTFAARREQVFRAWTEPEALARWFRPFGNPITVSQFELRVGGTYRFESNPADGQRSTIKGTYLEIVRPEKLVFTWTSEGTRQIDTLVIVEFFERGESTEIVLTHERLADVDMVRTHQYGWESILDFIADVL